MQVVNWKAADDGKGSIIRLLETGGKAVTAHLNFPLFKLESAWSANAAEDNLEALSPSGHRLEVEVKPHQIVTLRVVCGM